jgi:hypothetical protein
MGKRTQNEKFLMCERIDFEILREMWEIEFQGKQHVGNDFKGNIAMDLKKF